MRIVLLGPPGAGKGSLAELIKENFQVAHVSTGDMLREEMKKGSPIGFEIKKLIEAGRLVSDEIVTRLVEERMGADANLADSFMLDGFPRTAKQAEDLDRILKSFGKPLDFALNMEADIDIILLRLAGRRVCALCGALYHLRNRPPLKEGICDACGGGLYQRSDDNETTIRNRMNVYRMNTQPVIDYYTAERCLKQVNGDKETNEIFKDLLKILNERQE